MIVQCLDDMRRGDESIVLACLAVEVLDVRARGRIGREAGVSLDRRASVVSNLDVEGLVPGDLSGAKCLDETSGGNLQRNPAGPQHVTVLLASVVGSKPYREGKFFRTPVLDERVDTGGTVGQVPGCPGDLRLTLSVDVEPHVVAFRFGLYANPRGQTLTFQRCNRALVPYSKGTPNDRSSMYRFHHGCEYVSCSRWVTSTPMCCAAVIATLRPHVHKRPFRDGPTDDKRIAEVPTPQECLTGFWVSYMLTGMSIGRSFHVLLGANAASNLADGLAFVSIPLLAASLTDDPRLIAGLATVYALVRLLVALPIGVWVDRTDRRTLLVLANLLRGAAILALAICLSVGVEGLVLLYVAYGILGTLESAADNAAVSLVPSYVQEGDLDRANGRISATQLVADEFVGPPLGGLLFAVAATAPVFFMGGLWAAAGLLALALPRALKRPTISGGLSDTPAFWVEALDGLQWIAQNRVVGALALVGALASVGYMLPFSILVLFAQDRLGVNETQYGLILAVSALGGLAGSFLTSRVRARFGYRMIIAASLLTGAASLFALAITTAPVLAAILLAIYILHAVVWGICATSLRQRLVPEDLRGRVNAGSRVLGLLGLAIGSIAGGALATIDLALPVTVGGLVFIACAFLALLLIRTTDGQAPPAA